MVARPSDLGILDLLHCLCDTLTAEVIVGGGASIAAHFEYSAKVADQY